MRLTCFYLILAVCFFLISCHNQHNTEEPVIVASPEKMNDVVSGNIQNAIAYAVQNNGKVSDKITLKFADLAQAFYSGNNYKVIWSNNESKRPITDSLIDFINHCMYYGLFPRNYHQEKLNSLNSKILSDSLAVEDASLWTKLELLCSDAYFHLLRDLQEGRMTPDSLSIVNKKEFVDSFFIANLNKTITDGNLTSNLQSAEPTNFKYLKLREALKNFVDSMDTTRYIHIQFPYKDSLHFVKQVSARLLQEGIADSSILQPDSSAFSRAVKKYQKANGLTADGKIGPATVRFMNQTDEEKFLDVAITLDKYKKLKDFPETFVFVNIPAFSLEVWDHDSLLLQSKVIVGKPATPTPELESKINNMVIYPNWTIPESIIKKDILPQLKKDPGYLARKGYNLFTESGEMVDPYSVNWAKYKSGIPWKVVQGSGDDNALGVFKFNFSNPFSVYLHDTNQRYLFANANRALSHGCVRVQKWEDLADIIADRDSAMSAGMKISYSKDSINSWVANRVRKSVMVKNRLPLYILYLTCDARDNKIYFYDDIYGEDRKLADTYFKN